MSATRALFSEYHNFVTDLVSRAERCERAEQEARAWEEEATRWKALALKCSGTAEIWRIPSNRSVELKLTVLEEVIYLHRHPAQIAEHYAKQVYDHFMRFLREQGHVK